VRRRWGAIAVLAGAACLALGAPNAIAAKQWSSPKTISDSSDESVDFPKLALNGKGQAVAVWYDLDPATVRVTSIRSATREPGEGFGPATTIGPASEPGGNDPPSLPSVAIDRRGNAIAAWLIKDTAGSLRVVASFQPRGGDFGEPQMLSDPGQPAFDPAVAFDRGGDAIIVWNRFDGATTRVQEAVKPAKQQEFGAPETLSATGVPAGPAEVGMSDSGAAVVTWQAEQTQPPNNGYVQAAKRSKKGGFGPPQTLSDQNLDADDAQLAVSPNGNAVAAWTQAEGNDPAEIGTALAPKGEPFQPVVAIPPQTGMETFNPRLGIDRFGRATLLWRESPPEGLAGTNLVRAERTNKGGTFTSNQTLDNEGIEILEPAVAVSRAGNAVAAWIPIPMNPPNPLDVAVRGRRQKAFGALETLTPTGVSAGVPSLGTNRRIAIAVWEVSTGDAGTSVMANVYRKR
jgi:hypothetical protein